VTEQHAQTTSRTARAVADEMARSAAEQSELGMQAQQENVHRFAETFMRAGEAGAAHEARGPHGVQGTGAAQQSGARAPEHT
jgi:hypothetical protein